MLIWTATSSIKKSFNVFVTKRIIVQTVKTQTSSPSYQPKSSKPIPFSSTFDPSNPTAFLKNVFDFIAKESTSFFDNDSAEKVVLSAICTVKVKKAKITVEEKMKVDKAAAVAEKKAKDVYEKEDEKKDEESGLTAPNQGNLMRVIIGG
ncbi:hypothetical protein MtrunA17_Chr6g0477351 [Medicago truncatula]|uniref:Uncharacterized protein n=1 Tax=Medicago truncatula TaxID=3880 RepID=A0A396HHS9_MEDTR|nr:hypothetical protein MtrunA17_Chr6g0477351 [Medicago truncatula]